MNNIKIGGYVNIADYVIRLNCKSYYVNRGTQEYYLILGDIK